MRKGAGNKKIIIISTAVLAAAGVLIFAAVLRMGSVSGSTESLLNESAVVLDDETSDRLKEEAPISNNTKKLMSSSTLVMQNPNYLWDEESEFHAVDIGSDEQDKILSVIRKDWPEDRTPWENGYEGLCESWVCTVYHDAGLPTKGSCCASVSRERLSFNTDSIPVGAMIYSGSKYESGKICEVCGSDPGHVAIYLGDGKVAGSQAEYIMDIEDFKELFGYGGWSFSGNSYSF